MKYLICYIENITKHVFQELLKAVTMAVLLSLLTAGLLPAGTVLAEESASFSWYNPETGYDILTVSKGSREAPEWVKGWKKPVFD